MNELIECLDKQLSYMDSLSKGKSDLMTTFKLTYMPHQDEPSCEEIPQGNNNYNLLPGKFICELRQHFEGPNVRDSAGSSSQIARKRKHPYQDISRPNNHGGKFWRGNKSERNRNFHGYTRTLIPSKTNPENVNRRGWAYDWQGANSNRTQRGLGRGRFNQGHRGYRQYRSGGNSYNDRYHYWTAILFTEFHYIHIEYFFNACEVRFSIRAESSMQWRKNQVVHFHVAQIEKRISNSCSAFKHTL